MAVSTDRRQGVNSSAAIKVPCRCATTANITLSGLQTIDGITVVADDRVLVKNQSTASQNGIYAASSSAWVRTIDCDGTFDLKNGTLVRVNGGTVNAGTWYAVSTADPITVGTTALSFSPTGAAAFDDANVSVQRTETGSTLTTLHAAIQNDALNALVFDATIDNTGGSDVSTKLQAFIDACEVSGYRGYIPPGTYDVSTMLVNDVGIEIFGQRYKTILRRRAGASIASIVHVGPTSSTTAVDNFHWHDILFEGNSGCTDAVFKVRNVGNSTFERIRVKSGAAVGFRTDTSTDNVNTRLNYNTYDKIEAMSNTGIGIKFQGEKDATFGALVANGNGGDGIEFKGFKYDGNTLAETTECTVASVNSVINTGSGVVFDQCEKYAVALIETHHNVSYGIKFKGTLAATSGNGGNSVNIGVVVSRNDELGGIACLTADGGVLSSASINSATLIGFGSDTDSKGIWLQGAQGINFGSVKVVGYPGNAVTIEAGNPYGAGAIESTRIKFGTLVLDSNGHVSATNNHGLNIQGSSARIYIGHLDAANSQTTGAAYEITTSNTAGPIVIASAMLNPNAAANSIASSTAVMDILSLQIGSEAPVSAIRDGITAPTATANGFARRYVDTADGDYKIRYADTVVKTIVVDT